MAAGALAFKRCRAGRLFAFLSDERCGALTLHKLLYPHEHKNALLGYLRAYEIFETTHNLFKNSEQISKCKNKMSVKNNCGQIFIGNQTGKGSKHTVKSYTTSRILVIKTKITYYSVLP